MSNSELIGIIDYGMGNLRSVSKAIEHLGGRVVVSGEVEKLKRTKKLVLPGVGAFGDAIRELRKRKIVRLLRAAFNQGTPLLGICLGLQLFFERSEESPRASGLGIWKGTVEKFRATKTAQRKIPHMGWNQVRFRKRIPLVSKVSNNTHFYFVHSYYAKPKDPSIVVGATHYGVQFPAVLASKNVHATQFHPEKSQGPGLQILKNFIEI